MKRLSTKGSKLSSNFQAFENSQHLVLGSSSLGQRSLPTAPVEVPPGLPPGSLGECGTHSFPLRALELRRLQIAASSLTRTSLRSSCQPCRSLSSFSQHVALPGSSLLPRCAVRNSFSVLSFSFLCLSFPPLTHAALQFSSHARYCY